MRAAELRTHLLTYPDDFHAMREFALALLANNQAAEAAAVIAKAYGADPLLATEAVDLAELALDGAKVKEMLGSAQGVASKAGANAWLLVAVLHQGQADGPKALAALEKARKAGLSPDLAELMGAALDTKGKRGAGTVR
jgi:hypothetical protein